MKVLRNLVPECLDLLVLLNDRPTLMKVFQKFLWWKWDFHICKTRYKKERGRYETRRAYNMQNYLIVLQKLYLMLSVINRWRLAFCWNWRLSSVTAVTSTPYGVSAIQTNGVVSRWSQEPPFSCSRHRNSCMNIAWAL